MSIGEIILIGIIVSGALLYIFVYLIKNFLKIKPNTIAIKTPRTYREKMIKP